MDVELCLSGAEFLGLIAAVAGPLYAAYRAKDAAHTASLLARIDDAKESADLQRQIRDEFSQALRRMEDHDC